MGDARFRQHLQSILQASDRAAAIRALDDDAVVEALAAASEEKDPYLANVLASEAMNRMRRSRAISRHLGEGVCAIDGDGRILSANPSAERKLGWSEPELVGQDFHDTVHYQDAEGRPVAREDCPLLRAVLKGETLRQESAFARRDGTTFPVIYTASPVVRDGVLEGGVIVFRNTSAEKEAERALRGSEARKRSVLEASLDAIIMIDGDSKVLEWNPAAERIFQVPASEVMGRDMTDIIVPERYRAAHRAGMARMVATGYGPVLNQRLDLPAIRSDGSEFPAELAIIAVETPRGQLFTGFLRDLTQQKLAERRRDAEHRTAAILAENGPLDETLDHAMAAVCESLGWQVGGFWEHDQGVLKLRRQHVQGDPSDYESFTALSRSLRFRSGEGLPGEVWSWGRPGWKMDVTQDPNFPRAAAARAAGLHGAVATPAMGAAQPLGVLEFFCRERRDLEDPELPNTLMLLGRQLGQFLERKRAEDSLRESEERFRSTFDDAAVGMAHVALDGRWLRVNQRLLTMLGYARDELEALRFADITHPDERESGQVALEKLLRGDVDVMRARRRCLHKQGHTVTTELVVSIAPGSSGAPRHLIAIFLERSEDSASPQRRH